MLGLDRRRQPEATPRHRLDDALRPAVVAHRPPRSADPRADRGIRDVQPAPDRSDQILAAEHGATGLGQHADQVEDLRFEMHRMAVPLEAVTLGIEDAAGETIGHAAPLPWGMPGKRRKTQGFGKLVFKRVRAGRSMVGTRSDQRTRPMTRLATLDLPSVPTLSLKGLVATLIAADAGYRDRRTLAEMPAHRLADIGL